MINLSDDFKKYIDYISFLHDLSNDAGIGNQSELIEMLKNDAKKLIAKEVIHSNQIAKAEVAVIGDFSSGKSSFINSIIGKNLCPVKASPTTSSITAFYYSDEVKILTNGDEISQSEYENLVKHNDPNTKSKAYDIKYFYPFESFRNVVLYDTPGFSNAGNLDNGKSGDTKLTMEKAKAVDVLLVVIDINTGSTGEKLVKRLLEIKNQNKDAYFVAVLNKSNQKPPAARKKIKEEILKNFEYKEIFVYDSEKLDKDEFINEKNKILSLFNKISKNKDKFIKDRFKNEKQDFMDNLSITLDAVSDDIINQIHNNAANLLNNLEDNNFDEMRASFEKISKKVCENLETIRKETYAERVEGFLDGIFGTDKKWHDEYYYIKEEILQNELQNFKNLTIHAIQNINHYSDINMENLNATIDRNLDFFANRMIINSSKDPYCIPTIEYYDEHGNEKLEIVKEFQNGYLDFFMQNTEFFESCINHSIDEYNYENLQIINKVDDELTATLFKIADFLFDNAIANYLSLCFSFFAKQEDIEILCDKNGYIIFDKKYFAQNILDGAKIILKNYSYDKNSLKKCIDNSLNDLEKELPSDLTKTDESRFKAHIIRYFFMNFKNELRQNFVFTINN